jgi:putative intracellular protease/amidase
MRVFFYVFDGYADWECGYLLAELASGRYSRRGPGTAEILTVGDSRGSVMSMGGLEVAARTALGEARIGSGDILVLPGGESWSGPEREGVIDFLSRPGAFRVAAICGATLGLARAGRLNHLRHTSNALEYLSLAGETYTGAQLYRYEPAVSDGEIVTATGLAPLEFALEVMKGIPAFDARTLEAWYALNRERSVAAYRGLLDSLQPGTGQ